MAPVMSLKSCNCFAKHLFYQSLVTCYVIVKVICSYSTLLVSIVFFEMDDWISLCFMSLICHRTMGCLTLKEEKSMSMSFPQQGKICANVNPFNRKCLLIPDESVQQSAFMCTVERLTANVTITEVKRR